MSIITALETYDIRFPTSLQHDGSDAMNVDPDYSAAYVILRTDDAGGLCGHGFVFTIGRGNDVQSSACAALRYLVVGRSVSEIIADLGAFARSLTNDSQLRWLGPEKGVMHMAIGAIVNAAWDMAARQARKPVWLLIADMTPEQIVSQIDFRYISDVLSPAEALAILRAAAAGKTDRIADLQSRGYPAYTTSPGWLGYSDEKLDLLARRAVEDGFRTIKLKVGLNLEDDIRRCGIAREAIGANVGLAIDANQRWDVQAAIRWLKHLEPYRLAWVEEPTSPDDILGHSTIRQGIAPIPISTGEHTQNRVIFKQFPLDSHSQAHVAAEAALAAQEQGKFWELHDLMYAHFREINRARILAWATEIGLDVKRLQADLDSHKFVARVDAEEHEGEVAEVEGTPTFFINGHRLNGAFDVATVAPLIDDALKH